MADRPEDDERNEGRAARWSRARTNQDRESLDSRQGDAAGDSTRRAPGRTGDGSRSERGAFARRDDRSRGPRAADRERRGGPGQEGPQDSRRDDRNDRERDDRFGAERGYGRGSRPNGGSFSRRGDQEGDRGRSGEDDRPSAKGRESRQPDRRFDRREGGRDGGPARSREDDRRGGSGSDGRRDDRGTRRRQDGRASRFGDDSRRGGQRGTGRRDSPRDDRRPGRDSGWDSRRNSRGDSGRPFGRDRDERPSQSRPQGGPRSWDRGLDEQAKRDRRREPALPEGVTGKELDRSVWAQLRTLSVENAEGVAAHLAAAALTLEDDQDRALLHAEHAARRAGRVPAVREALGLVHYRRQEFSDALREFKTARRLSGSDHLIPYMVDCERGLGRFDRALDLAASPQARELAKDDAIELAIVVSGVRRDMGQADAALIGLRIPALQRANKQAWAARLLYAYAEALLATGNTDQARDYFARAAEADDDGLTDADERLAELDGVDLVDLLGDEDEEFASTDGVEDLGDEGGS